VPLVALAAAWLVSGGDDSWAPVEVTDLALDVAITGRLQAVESSLIGPPQIPGMYRFKIAMMATEGETVTSGTPVLGFDTAELAQRLRARLNEVAEAEKQIERNRVNLQVQGQSDELALAEARAALRKAHLKTAVPEQLVSSVASRQARLELELAEIEVNRLADRIAASQRAGKAQIASVQSRLDRARGDVAQIESAIARMTRAAPRDGIVTYVTDWNNQKLKVGDSVWFRASVLEIPNLTTMRAEAEVEEALAGRLAPGQRVELQLDAHPDDVISGTVAHISSSVQRKSWNNPQKIVRLKVDLARTDAERMRPGMRFKGKVQVELLREVLTIPLTAVFASQAGPVVLRQTAFGHERVLVDLGQRNQLRVLVLDGLDQGDRVSTTWRPS
jgi:HlyD family secretion protein